MSDHLRKDYREFFGGSKMDAQLEGRRACELSFKEGRIETRGVSVRRRLKLPSPKRDEWENPAKKHKRS